MISDGDRPSLLFLWFEINTDRCSGKILGFSTTQLCICNSHPPGTDFLFQAHSWFGELYPVGTSYILSYLCLYYIISLMGFIYRSFMFILEFSSHYLFLVSSYDISQWIKTSMGIAKQHHPCYFSFSGLGEFVGVMEFSQGPWDLRFTKKRTKWTNFCNFFNQNTFMVWFVFK